MTTPTRGGAPAPPLTPAPPDVWALIGKEATPLPGGTSLSHAQQLTSWPIAEKVWLALGLGNLLRPVLRQAIV